ncbi:hypothetical protein HYV21_00240 [Candidatus Microgenomates bacterium]|nr:hypothetical protein [Candidatus Microgenomates bacterium]
MSKEDGEKPQTPESYRRLVIACDIDSTINDLFLRVLMRFNEEFGTSLQTEDISTFNFLPSFIEKYASHLTENEKNVVFQRYYRDPDLYHEAEPLPHAVPVLQNIGQNHVIHYVSARPTHLNETTVSWLSRHGLLFPETGVHLSTRAVSPNIGNTALDHKVAAINAIGAHLVIEDHQEVAEAMNVPVILLDWPWNRNATAHHITRVAGWHEIEAAVERLAKLR